MIDLYHIEKKMMLIYIVPIWFVVDVKIAKEAMFYHS